jgi:hypothetical protein
MILLLIDDALLDGLIFCACFDQEGWKDQQKTFVFFLYILFYTLAANLISGIGIIRCEYLRCEQRA